MTDEAHSQGDSLANFDKLWDYSKPAETEAKFRDLLPTAEKQGDASIKLQLLTQIARCQGLQRKFEEAHATLDGVEQQLSQAPPVVKIRYLLERGRAFNSANQKDKARPLFLQAWELGRDSAEDLDSFAVDAAHMMGIIEPADQAVAWNEKAMALAEASEDARARRWLGSLYNNLGWTYHDGGKFDKAMTLFQKGVEFREKQGQTGPLRIARWCVARCHRSLGHAEAALKMQMALLEEIQKDGQSDGFVFEELGECHLLLDQAEQARPYFAKAHEELSKNAWLKENEPKRLERLKELGGVK